MTRMNWYTFRSSILAIFFLLPFSVRTSLTYCTQNGQAALSAIGLKERISSHTNKVFPLKVGPRGSKVKCLYLWQPLSRHTTNTELNDLMKIICLRKSEVYV